MIYKVHNGLLTFIVFVRMASLDRHLKSTSYFIRYICYVWQDIMLDLSWKHTCISLIVAQGVKICSLENGYDNIRTMSGMIFLLKSHMLGFFTRKSFLLIAWSIQILVLSRDNSPGALDFEMETNLESWFFQESCLKVPRVQNRWFSIILYEGFFCDSRWRPAAILDLWNS